MSRDVLLFLAVFAACLVEAVEALTIVLAAGITRDWRSTGVGVACALVALAAIVGALGPALTSLPINVLRLIVGGLLLGFGLQWLRKAILRASGLKALHDEEQIFAAQVASGRAAASVGTRRKIDPYAFTLSFKGVLLEGLEVAFIVVTFGSNQHNVGLAAISAGAAIVVVVAAGVIARAPLSRVPENTLKFAVGIMLTAFGMFWSAEGAGAHWPGSDAAIVALIVFTLVSSLALVAFLRTFRRRPSASATSDQHEPTPHKPTRSLRAPARAGRLRAFGTFVYHFVIGDDPLIAVAVVVALGMTAAVSSSHVASWWVVPLFVVLVLATSLLRAGKLNRIVQSTSR